MNKPSQKEAYNALVKQHSTPSEKPLHLLRAFFVGGLICAFGQLFHDLGEHLLLLDSETTSLFTSACLIFIAALLTGIGVYDKIGRFAGAGSIVPITGFANSIVSPAMEFKKEGLITGVGAKMFVVAGPVLVYGITASVLVGLIYFFIGLFTGVQ